MKKVLVTGKRGNLSAAVADHMRAKNEYEVEQISLRGDEWRRVDFSGIESVVHIAGVTPQNAKSADDYYQINSELTKALAEKCKQDGVRQFIYISSMAVYGVEQSMDIGAGTVTKDTKPAPATDYGKSKLLAEEYITPLESSDYHVAIIRVPSIYGKGKTEYIDQYKYLAEKLPVIPRAFEDHYKSAICVDNLCELIYIVIKEQSHGVFCPDDGCISAVDFCAAVYPNKKKSRLLGLLMEVLLKRNARILDYYGAVCYSKEWSGVFDGRYRIMKLDESVRQAYEK